ncbi:hypothetical protein XU18_0600 [Perkinsela sp. CCAP 1560/4]|nr:hypothetical protein XU18_0600 [Perkinsela sp. CCAP 1560/4]|eukprot:KNH09090.1 hypothetical protein XU18_0600 [Perkinsela sp. CCAP 1560/4]
MELFRLELLLQVDPANFALLDVLLDSLVGVCYHNSPFRAFHDASGLLFFPRQVVRLLEERLGVIMHTTEEILALCCQVLLCRIAIVDSLEEIFTECP